MMFKPLNKNFIDIITPLPANLNKKLSLLPSGYFGKSSENIFVVEDFITKEEGDLLLFVAKNLNVWDTSNYSNKYTRMSKIQNENLEAADLILNICKKWKNLVENFYNVQVETYNAPISKWPINGFQKPHADKEWEDGVAADQNYYDIGSVIYLNDEYAGGEIYFPQHDMSIKPKKLSAISFPGDMFYLHGVTKIKNFERYTIPIFFTVKEYEIEKDKTIT